jgi:hypothetical protein
VVGVDIKPQPHYPFVFVQDDAIEYLESLVRMDSFGLGWEVAAIHASAPCQLFTAYRRKGHDVTLGELSEGIPPAYTRHIGEQLIALVRDTEYEAALRV